MPSILLKNGLIVDGLNNRAFPGHLLVENDRIAAVLPRGDHPLPEAEASIDVGGAVIAPGFIDMHSHSDWVLPRTDHPEAMKCLVEQGVTTIVGGNCGFSPAPLNERSRSYLRQNGAALLTDRPIDYGWAGMEDFFRRIESASPLVNLAQLAGHGIVRLGRAGLTKRTLSEDQLNGCLADLKHALEAGACGISFGLGYPPGMFSPLKEIEALFRLAAEADKPVTVHLKALSRFSPTYPATEFRPHNLRALKEILELAAKTGVRLQISHLIFVGKHTWPTAERALRMIEESRASGIDVMFDAFAYTFGNTTIDAVLPYWYIALREKRTPPAWARMLVRAELRLGFTLLGFSYRDFQLMDGGHEKWRDLNGMRVTEIARKWRCPPFAAVLRLSKEVEGGAAVMFHSYSGAPGDERVIESVLSHPLCLFETDALTRFDGFPNPAAVGNFPRILEKYVRNRRLFTLENAIHRMTAASADRFGIKDRGRLTAGSAADLTVFDPDAIAETPAAGTAAAGRSTGILYVFVNGRKVFENGRFLETGRAGRVLRV